MLIKAETAGFASDVCQGSEIRGAVPPPPSKLSVLDVVVKVAERCNLVCPYCYFFFAGDETHKLHPPLMSRSTVESLAKYLATAADEFHIDLIRVGLHGGEPLLMSKDRMGSVVEVLKSALARVPSVQFVIQTNGVLINDEWVDFLAHHGFRVSVSFDGLPAHHDRTRIDKKGRGTYAQTAAGFNKLQSAYEAGRLAPPGVLCVVDPSQDGAETYHHLSAGLGAQHMNFLLPDLTNDAHPGEEFIDGCTRYLIAVFDAWRRGPRGKMVRFINDITGPLVNDSYLQRSRDEKFNSSGLISVSSNGEVSPDDTIRPLAVRFREGLPRVQSSSFAETLNHAVWGELRAAEVNRPAKCLDCQWLNVCRSGMPHHRFSVRESFDNPSVYCRTLMSLHHEVFQRLTRAGYDEVIMTRRVRPDRFATSQSMEQPNVIA